MHSRLVTLVSCMLLSGVACTSHVKLKRTPANASLRERQAAYESLRPRGTNHTLHLNKYGSVIAESTDSLVLANGETVHSSEDLLRVVHIGSPTARAAKRAESAGFKARFLMTAGAAAAIAGLAMGLGNLGDSEGAAYGGIGALAGTGLLVVGRWYYAPLANNERRAAFATYDASLRESLDLCVRGDRLVDCATQGVAGEVMRFAEEHARRELRRDIPAQRHSQEDSRKETPVGRSEGRAENGSTSPSTTLALGEAKFGTKLDPASQLTIATFLFQASDALQLRISAKWAPEGPRNGPIEVAVISRREGPEKFADDSILVLVSDGEAPLPLESRWSASQLHSGVTREVVAARLPSAQFLARAEGESIEVRVGSEALRVTEATMGELRLLVEAIRSGSESSQ